MRKIIEQWIEFSFGIRGVTLTALCDIFTAIIVSLAITLPRDKIIWNKFILCIAGLILLWVVRIGLFIMFRRGNKNDNK